MPWIPKKHTLRKVREEAGHTIYTLAIRSGVSERQIRKIESDDPPGAIFGSNLYALCDALGCKKEELATWTAKRPRREAAVVEKEQPKRSRRNGALLKPKTLSDLAELERTLRLREGLDPQQIETEVGSFDLLSSELLWECHTHFGAFEKQRFIVLGRVEQHRPLSHAAATLLRTSTGVGARFQLGRDIAYGAPLMVTVITTSSEETRQLLDIARADEAAAVVARVHVARPAGHWKGFTPIESPDERLPFALVVEHVLAEVPQLHPDAG
jgi:transcriptional regulator with XRE-family HTH domain